MLFNRFAILLAAAALVGFLAPQAGATLLYENPVDLVSENGDCTFNSACLTNNFGATRFTLSGASTIQTVGFNAIVTGNPFPLPGVDWRISADGGAVPGSAIASGDNFTSAFGFPQVGDFFTHFRYTVDVPDFNLSAGTYWLAFHVISSTTINDIFWSLAQNVTPVATSTDGGVNFASGYAGFSSLAIRVDGQAVVSAVPLPAAMPLFLSGLAGLGFMRRRRRRE